MGELSACEILRKDPQVNVEIRFSREKLKDFSEKKRIKLIIFFHHDTFKGHLRHPVSFPMILFFFFFTTHNHHDNDYDDQISS